jgi:hypothetical protein
MSSDKVQHTAQDHATKVEEDEETEWIGLSSESVTTQDQPQNQSIGPQPNECNNALVKDELDSRGLYV